MWNFELDLTSHLFHKFITVVSTILLHHMYGRRFILFLFPPRFHYREEYEYRLFLIMLYVTLNTAFENKTCYPERIWRLPPITNKAVSLFKAASPMTNATTEASLCFEMVSDGAP